MKRLLFHASLPIAAMLFASASYAAAESITGKWRTPTGSIVQVYPCGDAVCLRVVAVEKTAPGTLDENNPNPTLRSRSICGLQIGSGFKPKQGSQSAEDGQIYDPKTGKTYSGSLALSGADHLELRGYIGVKLFGRTEEWTRSGEAIPPCR